MAKPLPAVALIGVTGYARLHLDHLLRLAGEGWIRLVAATVVNPDQAGEALAMLAAVGAEIHADYRSMLTTWSGRLDLCAIPTAISLHRPMTEAALAAGAHVLVEKPLAGCLVDAQAIADAAQAAGRSVLVGFQDAWDPATAAVHECLAADAVGPLRRIVIDGSWPRSSAYYLRNGWAGRTHDGCGAVNDSPVTNAFAHFVQLALGFAGSAPVAVAGSLLRANRIGTFDTALVDIATAGGPGIRLALTHADPEWRQPVITLHGGHGRLAWQHDGPVVLHDGGAPRTIAVSDSDEGRRRMFAAAAELAAGRPHVAACTAASALNHARLIDLLAALPVEEIPGVDHARDGGEIQRCIPGIGERIRTWIDGGTT
jgi:predicted dehydrogenase